MNTKTSKSAADRGFTLIELIVVILIIGIASAALIMSLTSVMNANTRRAASELSSMLDKARLDTMSMTRDSRALEIYMQDGNYYAATLQFPAGTSSGDEVKLGNRNVTITALASGEGAGDLVIDGNNSLLITFDKGSGAFRSAVQLSGDPAASYGSSAMDYDAVSISGSRTTVIHLVAKTGRNYIGS